MGPSQRQMSRSRHVPVLRAPFASPFRATPPRKRVPMKLRSSDDELRCLCLFLSSFLRSLLTYFLLLQNFNLYQPQFFQFLSSSSLLSFLLLFELYLPAARCILHKSHCIRGSPPLFNYIVREIFTRCRLLRPWTIETVSRR